jgi:hypothetical protein
MLSQVSFGDQWRLLQSGQGSRAAIALCLFAGGWHPSIRHEAEPYLKGGLNASGGC